MIVVALCHLMNSLLLRLILLCVNRLRICPCKRWRWRQCFEIFLHCCFRHQSLGPGAILRQVIFRLCGIRSVPAARLIHCGFHGILGLIMPRFLLHPLFLLASPRLISGLFPLAPASLRIVLHCGYLLHSVSSIRKVFPSFVMVIVLVLILARRESRQWITCDCRLHWISQRVAIGHPDHFG